MDVAATVFWRTPKTRTGIVLVWRDALSRFVSGEYAACKGVTNFFPGRHLTKSVPSTATE